MAVVVEMTDLLEKAKTWAVGDPDPETRAEIEGLVAEGDIEGLEARFAPELTFGTAGIRGRVGAGPGRMNRAVVIRVTAGLASYLLRTGPGVVILGFDARPTSPVFAEDVAGVLAAAGLEVVWFREPTPTPLVAYTARHLGAAAAVVVTASHNPPEDNGYKVYGSNAAQIIPPVDTEISAAIRSAPPADQVPRLERPFSRPSPLVVEAPADIFERYRDEVNLARPNPTGSDLRIVYTPIHGCGGETVSRLFEAAGHRNLIRVEEQYEPDGTFPTVGFPNPEEKGALDLAVATARAENADLIIANDPDADRLAVVLPLAGEWRALSGNDLGCLLGDYVLRYCDATDRPIVVSSVVSSPMMGLIAAARDAHHESSLTGFKWIVNAGLALQAAGEGTFVFGYEEALGYTVGQVVRDKDGMSAALVFSDLAESLRRKGETVWDRLVELWREVGVWSSAQHSVTRSGPDGVRQIAEMVRRLGERPPEKVGGLEVGNMTDYSTGAELRPPWLGAQDLIEVSFGPQGRALVRPSGTEPKMKIYVDLTEEAGPDPLGQQGVLTERAAGLAASLAGLMDR
jgi:phosphomannomutase